MQARIAIELSEWLLGASLGRWFEPDSGERAVLQCQRTFCCPINTVCGMPSVWDCEALWRFLHTAIAPAEQLRDMFDENLLVVSEPGQEAQFEAQRFALRLETMLESGEQFVADKLLELPEDLVTDRPVPRDRLPARALGCRADLAPPRVDTLCRACFPPRGSSGSRDLHVQPRTRTVAIGVNRSRIVGCSRAFGGLSWVPATDRGIGLCICPGPGEGGGGAVPGPLAPLVSDRCGYAERER